jgi:hypothetical protein
MIKIEKSGIITISMVRDEDDILDLWLKQTSQWSELMVIIDHVSSPKIAHKLVNWCENNNGIYLRYESPKYRQSYAVNSVLKNLLNYLPDSAIVVPLDADEFLSQRTIKNLHTVLKENPDINVRIPWRNAYPKTYKSIVDNINRSTPLKIAIQLSSSFKVSSTVGHIRRRNLRFSQGGHFLIRPNGYFADSESSDELEILHMPLRSLEQYNNKITKGINAYDAKNKLGIFQRRLGLHW